MPTFYPLLPLPSSIRMDSMFPSPVPLSRRSLRNFISRIRFLILFDSRLRLPPPSTLIVVLVVLVHRFGRRRDFSFKLELPQPFLARRTTVPREKRVFLPISIRKNTLSVSGRLALARSSRIGELFPSRSPTGVSSPPGGNPIIPRSLDYLPISRTSSMSWLERIKVSGRTSGYGRCLSLGWLPYSNL